MSRTLGGVFSDVRQLAGKLVQNLFQWANFNPLDPAGSGFAAALLTPDQRLVECFGLWKLAPMFCEEEQLHLGVAQRIKCIQMALEYLARLLQVALTQEDIQQLDQRKQAARFHSGSVD